MGNKQQKSIKLKDLGDRKDRNDEAPVIRRLSNMYISEPLLFDDFEIIDSYVSTISAAVSFSGLFYIGDKYGKTILMQSVINGEIERLKRILEYLNRFSFYIVESILDYKDGYGNTALYYTHYTDNGCELAELLLSAGASINKVNNYGITPLIKAVVSEREKLVTLLVERNSDVNYQDENDETALMHAVRIGNVVIVEKLIDMGANKKLRNTSGMTAAKIALQKLQETGNPDILRLVS